METGSSSHFQQYANESGASEFEQTKQKCRDLSTPTDSEIMQSNDSIRQSKKKDKMLVVLHNYILPVRQCSVPFFWATNIQTALSYRRLRSLLEEHIVSISVTPTKNHFSNCEHLRSSGWRTVASIIWISEASHTTSTTDNPSTRLLTEKHVGSYVS